MKKTTKKVIRKLIKYCIFMLLVVVVFLGIRLWHRLTVRGHGQVYVVETTDFTETADYLDNPNRGFYYMYGFKISDDEETNYRKVVAGRLGPTYEMKLAMVQINLQQYNNRPISEKGLNDIRNLFQALRDQDKHYLVRFLYDWNGQNEEVEPQEVDTILTHMRQLKDIFHDYQDIIFVHQGIFIGNWGEMNGTKHLEHMQRLALTLHEVMPEDMFFGVRMPAQWRKITECANPSKEAWEDNSVAHRLSLYNDGMMGSFSDYGTYGHDSRDVVGDLSCWNREEELAFQEELCKYVPNGGEVIVDNEYNDFENALVNLNTMHITYLNRDYDQNVLNKWANTIVEEDGVFDGMDGLTYVERHLGYRFLIKDVGASYDWKQDKLDVDISLQNVGFAPIYKEAECNLIIMNEKTKDANIYLISQDIRALVGGNDCRDILHMQKELRLSGLEAGEYSIYFCVKDVDSGKVINFANEQEIESYGYRVGTIQVESIKETIQNMVFESNDY